MGLLDRFRPRPPVPPAEWPARLGRAQALMDDLHYRAATDLLAPLVSARDGPAPLMPTALGMLGECQFQSGRAGEAVGPTEEALRRLGGDDSESRLALLGNLYEIHRYRGDGPRAADRADEIAAVLSSLGRAAEADRYRRRAVVARAGEPAVRAVVELDGVLHEVDEVVEGRAGAVRFALERNRLTLRPAERRLEEAAVQASVGHFADALTLLEEAVAVDPFAPEPHFRAGLTSAYLERYGEAADSLAACERLTPGWSLARPALWLARQLERGAVGHDTFVAWHALEEGPLNPEVKVALAERALAEAPRLALLHLMHGKALKARLAPAAAEAAFRRALALADQPDARTRCLVELASVVASEGEKAALLRETVAVGGDLIAAATARVVLAFA